MRIAVSALVFILAGCAHSPRAAETKPLPPLPAPDPPVVGEPFFVKPWPSSLQKDIEEPRRTPSGYRETVRGRTPVAPPDPDEEVLESVLDAVDLAACLTPGAEHSMHIAVVFAPQGWLIDVLVPPDAADSVAAQCMKRSLVGTRVALFAGAAVTRERTIQGH